MQDLKTIEVQLRWLASNLDSDRQFGAEVCLKLAEDLRSLSAKLLDRTEVCGSDTLSVSSTPETTYDFPDLIRNFEVLIDQNLASPYLITT